MAKVRSEPAVATTRDGHVWSEAYYYDSTNGWLERGLDINLNHSDPTPSEFSQADDTDELPFFLVRNIGEPVMSEDSSAPAGNYPYDTWSAPVAAEFSTLGYMTSINYVQITDAKAGATVGFDINTGGSVAMSGAVVLGGTDFLGTTSVTFSGVPALFIVNSDFQITIDAPPGTAQEVAQVVVTNANGPSQAAFYRYQ